MSDIKVFNPESGNYVDIVWAEGQGIIDEEGNYLDEDGEPTTIFEVADPEIDLTEEELETKSKETKGRATEEFGPDVLFETSGGEQIQTVEQAETKVEELIGQKNELETKSNFLYEEKQRLEGQLDSAKNQIEAESKRADRLQDQLQDAQDTILDLRQELREAETAQEEAEERVDELEDTERTYSNTDIGGVRVDD